MDSPQGTFQCSKLLHSFSRRNLGAGTRLYTDSESIPPKKCYSTSISDVLHTASERLGAQRDDVVNHRKMYEQLPPGFDYNCRPLLPSSCVSQHSKSFGAHKIEKYVVIGMCRKRLHHDVLEEWKSIFLNDAFNDFFISWCNLREQSTRDVCKVVSCSLCCFHWRLEVSTSRNNFNLAFLFVFSLLMLLNRN